MKPWELCDWKNYFAQKWNKDGWGGASLFGLFCDSPSPRQPWPYLGPGGDQHPLLSNPTTLIIINHAMQLTLSSAWSSLPWSPWSSLSCSTSSYLCFNIIVPIVVVVRKISWNQSPCPLSIIFTTILIPTITILILIPSSSSSSSSSSLAGVGITLASLRPLRMGWSNIWLDPRWISRRNHHRRCWTVRMGL